MVTRRDLTDPVRTIASDDPEAGLKAPEYENIDIPEEFGPVQIEVDDLKVLRFAFVTGHLEPWQLTERPFSRRVAPAAILANDLLQLFTLTFAPSQVVGLHTEEEMWFDQPIHVGDVAELSGTYVEKYERRGQGYVVMEAAARDAEGRPYVRHRGVEIMRTVPGAVAGRGSAGSASQASKKRPITAEYDPQLPAVVTAGSGLVAGARIAPMVREITQEQASVFSRHGEYVVNIHNDLATARAAGLDAPIVQGQLMFCHLVTLLTRVFGATWYAGGHLHCKFLKPVSAIDTIELSGAVHDVVDAEGGPRAELDVWVRRGDGELAVVGWADAEVPTGEPTLCSLPTA
jgi:acyl dehydratase